MRTLVLRLCCCPVLFLVAPGSWAATMIGLTDEELIDRSPLIVMGQCTDVKSVWHERRLLTLATIHVQEALMGPCPLVSIGQ